MTSVSTMEGADVFIKLKGPGREFNLTILETNELTRDHLIEPTPGEKNTYHVKCGNGFSERWWRVKGFLKKKGIISRREAKEL